MKHRGPLNCDVEFTIGVMSTIADSYELLSRVGRIAKYAILRLIRSLPRTIILTIIACWASFLLFFSNQYLLTRKELPKSTTIRCPCRSYISYLNRTEIAVYFEMKLADSLKFDKGRGCDIPNLDPFSKDATENDTPPIPILCGPLDWVKCRLSKCRIQDEVLETVSGVRCEFRDIIYITDFNHTMGPVTYVTGRNVYELQKSDHVNVICVGTNISSGEVAVWSANTLGFRNIAPPPVPPGREQTPDVIIFLVDSTSKTGFIRLMPESWKVLVEVLEVTVMHGFNIVGDGTPYAVLPLLTGRTELELPDVRRDAPEERYFDDFPFIFDKLKKDGYRTAYLEDMPIDGTFQYRFQGFTRQPTDHYLRAFREANKPLFTVKSWDYCLGDTPQYKVMMNITEQFLDLDGKHFVMTCISDISHEDLNMVQVADGEMAAFLRRLAKRADDKLIIVMGDHGPRFAKIRRKNSIRAKLDERLPLLTIRLPRHLRTDRRAQRALDANSHVLTTVHDLHATILDVLDMRQHWNTYKVPGADLYRALTMLETIPRNRSCSEAGVDTHWCTCLVWEDLPASDRLYNKAAQALIDYINWLVQDTGSQCVPRTLLSIRWVSRQRTNDDLLTFAGSEYYDGYLPRYLQNYRTNMTTESYNLAIVAGPGAAEFEASMVYFMKEDAFVVLAEDISRTNAYKGESNCIADTHPHLAAYCYCAGQENHFEMGSDGF